MFIRPLAGALLSLPLSLSCIGMAWSVQDIGRAVEGKEKEKFIRTLPETVDIDNGDNKAAKSGVRSGVGDEYKLHVVEFIIEGESELIDISKAKEYFINFEGGDYSFDELQRIVDDINSTIFDLGYVTSKFYFPPQDVTDGQIIINLMEGVIDPDDSFSLYSEITNENDNEFLVEYFESKVRGGEILDNEELEESLLILSDFPSVTASANLKPGKYENSTKIDFKVKSDDVVNVIASADNYGSRYTGEYRYIAGVTWNNPTSIKDSLSISLLTTGGMGSQLYGQAKYKYYLGRSGLNLDLSQSWMSSEFGGVFEPLESQSQASVSNIGLSLPLLKKRKGSLDVSLGYERKKLVDEIMDVRTNERFVDRGAISTNFNFSDGFVSGAYNVGKMTYFNGYIDLTGIQSAYDADQAPKGAKTHGSFEKITYYYRRIQNLGYGLTALIDFDGQQAFNNLNSAEKYSLGGAYGVRAYPDGELSGDNAIRLALDVKYKLPFDVYQTDSYFYVFYDWGEVERYYDSSEVYLIKKNKVSLQGGGVGFEINRDSTFSFSITGAWQANRDSDYFTEYNSDGTKDRERILAGFSYIF
ncbi:ShlB/FhaC/HecB family hemolysin secretion/activation protein [Enterovibrio norvegicus]|uniref:ShlB/FhaC/HecB family hemolysin secretion/activation protein n=1 Tax=Enterovibrio norvegicus TaxID=188144 RepID=UPI0024B284D9|nr:ShlB/FhaC/HecB family hemolysin secretion/activation protein [Enterovibrio norvegicus]